MCLHRCLQDDFPQVVGIPKDSALDALPVEWIQGSVIVDSGRILPAYHNSRLALASTLLKDLLQPQDLPAQRHTLRLGKLKV